MDEVDNYEAVQSRSNDNSPITLNVPVVSGDLLFNSPDCIGDSL